MLTPAPTQSIPEQVQLHDLKCALEAGNAALIGPTDHPIPLPESVRTLMQEAVRNLLEGRAVKLVPQKQRLSTQAAADLLGFSRPHLIKLLQQGNIPFERVGQHRRLRLTDVLTFQAKRDAERRSVLNDLARTEFNLGHYVGTPIPIGGSDE